VGGGGGMNDGMALVVGAFLMVATGVPLLLVLPAVVSRNRVVVRALGFITGGLSVGCAYLLGPADLAHLGYLMPGLVLAVTALCSAFSAYGRPAELARQPDLPIRPKGER
jgi:hypothetical protein